MHFGCHFRVTTWWAEVVDRARVNSTTRYRLEASAESLYQVGLFTSTLSDLYHGCFFLITRCVLLKVFFNYHIS